VQDLPVVEVAVLEIVAEASEALSPAQVSPLSKPSEKITGRGPVA